MNYGRRTTKTTTTHRDTPLSATPEPRFAMFDEITVTPSKEQIKSYTGKWNKESDILNRDSNIKGTLMVEERLPTNTDLKKVSSWPSTSLLDYGNPADKPDLTKISTSRANLEKAKKDNAAINRRYNKQRKEYLDAGGED